MNHFIAFSVGGGVLFRYNRGGCLPLVKPASQSVLFLHHFHTVGWCMIYPPHTHTHTHKTVNVVLLSGPNVVSSSPFSSSSWHHLLLVVFIEWLRMHQGFLLAADWPTHASVLALSVYSLPSPSPCRQQSIRDCLPSLFSPYSFLLCPSALLVYRFHLSSHSLISPSLSN